ncbi:hypothetical protein TNCV_3192771 [Trichonephila clavipes]|nr:hypothetical protein TNCV_3192771 [Trichonephila clavipes]
MGGRDGDLGYLKARWKSGKFCSPYFICSTDLLMLALLRECSCFLSFRTSSHGCFRCIGSSCITRLTPSRVRSLDVPPCTMSRTPTRFKQHRVTTTRPMNCYAVSTRLRRSGHHLWMYPLAP